jgi:hypothetical protein
MAPKKKPVPTAKKKPSGNVQSVQGAQKAITDRKKKQEKMIEDMFK